MVIVIDEVIEVLRNKQMQTLRESMKTGGKMLEGDKPDDVMQPVSILQSVGFMEGLKFAIEVLEAKKGS